MSNKKQTAVEWLESFMLKPLSQWPDDYWEQAKEMEKQQRINDINFGHGIPTSVNINYEAYFKIEKK